MKIIVEQAITRAERAAVARIRQQVFEREMGLGLKPLSEFDGGSHLLARIEPNRYPVGALSVIDTSGDHDLHKSFGLGFGQQARAARLSHLAVLAPYRRMNIPLMMLLNAFREIVGPGGFDYRPPGGLAQSAKTEAAAPTKRNLAGGHVPPAKSRKLTTAEKRELEALPAQIEKLETEQAELTTRLIDPTFFQREPAAARAAQTRLTAIEQETATAFARWEELEAARTAASS